MKKKKIVIDIIRKKKKKINKISNSKTAANQNFLYNNDDLFAKNIGNFDEKDHCNSNKPENEIRNIPKISANIKQLFNINNRSYLRFSLLVFIFLIFFSVNKLSNNIPSVDINDLAQELENENKFYEQEIAKLHQNDKDKEKLSAKVDNVFEELSQLNAIPTIDELNDLEKELFYEIDNLSDDINELELLSDSNYIGNIDDDIRYNLN